MENNKNKKSVKFQGHMINFCNFIQVFVFTTNHHLKENSHKIQSEHDGKPHAKNSKESEQNFKTGCEDKLYDIERV